MIDTPAKAASALGFGFIFHAFIIPDGSIDLADKQTLLHLYSGVQAEIQPDTIVSSLSIITNSPVGSNSLITDTQGTASLIAVSVGSQSIITNSSVGTNSLITPSQGSESEL